MYKQKEYSKEVIDRILQGYIDKIFAFALKKTMNREDAEDLSQDIVFELLRSARSLRDFEAFHGWLWSVARNTWKRWINKKNKLNQELYDGVNMFLVDTAPGFEDTLILREDINSLRREIALLSQIKREVTVLYYIENKSCEEISNMLHISKGMVKQHLFKARKNLKEGMDMDRKFGEKSYNPKDFVFGFWGELGTVYYKMFERKLPKNIVISAYEKPVSIEEISIDTGIPGPYLEDELKILLDGDVLIRNKEGKYQTNFIIILKELQQKLDEVLEEKCGALALELVESFNKDELEIRNMGFAGSHFQWEKLLWTFIPLSMFFSLNRIQSEFLNEPPLLKTGIRGWPNARERSVRDWDFGVYNHNNPGTNLGYWSCNFLKLQKDTSYIFGPDDDELILLKNFYTGEKDISQFGHNELESLAKLLAQGFIKKDSQNFIPNFIGMKDHCFQKFIQMETQNRNFVYDEFRNILDNIVKILEPEIPRHLKEQAEAYGFMSLLYSVSHVIGYLNEQGILKMPPDAEKNTTAFCMFIDCQGIIPGR